MKPTDTQAKIKQSILELEHKYPVQSWLVNNVDVWPYIRIRIYLNMLVFSGKTDSVNRKITEDNGLVLTGLLNKLKLSLRLIIAPFRLQLFYLRLKKKKALLFGSHFHRVLFNGKYFNRFYDSIIEQHHLQNDVYMVEYLKILDPIYNEKALINLTKRLQDFKLISKLKSKKGLNKDLVKLNEYLAFYKDLGNLSLDIDTLKVSENDLIEWTRKMNTLTGFYNKLYKKTNPSKIVFLGYYGYDDLYAALITANNMNICTVDFQHGPQTNIHMAYSSWSKVPKSGFNTMPREFWTWDENSKKNIDAWMSKNNFGKVSVIGQPFIKYSLANISKLNPGKVILYSLQVEPIEQLSRKLINLIKNSGYLWNLRLHPRSAVNEFELEQYLKSNGLNKNFKIQDSIKYSLPESLMNCILHVTNFSGCLIEASLMGVPSLIINNVGKEMFQDYIDDRLVHYINEDDVDFKLKFEELINNITSQRTNLTYQDIPNPF